MAGDIVMKKIRAGDYTFREDLVVEMEYVPAEEGGPPKGRQPSRLNIWFVGSDESTTLKGEEADIAWRKYTEDAR